MKTLLRTLTLSAAALAALVAAPKSEARDFRWGGGREMRTFRGETFRGHEFREHEFRGGDFRGREFRGREFFDRGWHNRPFFHRPAFFFGRRHVVPFRVFAGSRFFSFCPGPGYIFVDDLGWVFPPFVGAVWVPAHFNRFGVWVGGCWR
jgi:hypothetical protein